MRAIPDLAKSKFFTENAWWTGGTTKIYALSSAYVYDPTDQFIGDVTGIIATATLGTLTVVGKQAKAANTSFGSPAAGSSIAALMVWKDTGVAGTSWLMYYTNEGTRLPMTTHAMPITIEWPSGVVLELT